MKLWLALMSSAILLGGCQPLRGEVLWAFPDAGPPPNNITDADAHGCHPNSEDFDEDGISDLIESDGDRDHDGLINSRDADSDADGVLDSVERRSSNPCSPADSDGDGYFDFLDPDSDNDGVRDREELLSGTNPTQEDTDGDGYLDVVELVAIGCENEAGEVVDGPTCALDPQAHPPERDHYVVLWDAPARGALVPSLPETDAPPLQQVGNEAVGPLLPATPETSEDLTFRTDIRNVDLYFLIEARHASGFFVRDGPLGLGFLRNLVERIGAAETSDGTDSHLQIGVGAFSDFPSTPGPGDFWGAFGIPSYGTHRGDVPFMPILTVRPFGSDRGILNIRANPAAGAEVDQYPVQVVDGLGNTIVDLEEALYGVPRLGGGNWAQSTWEALYATATGEPISWPETISTDPGSFDGYTFVAGNLPGSNCPLDRSGARRVGHACFRPDSLPIIVLASGSPLYEPLPTGWPAAPEGWGEPVTYGSTIPNARSATETLEALNRIGARVLPVIPHHDRSGPSAEHSHLPTHQLCEIARATGTVIRNEDGDVVPVCIPVDYTYAGSALEFDVNMLDGLTELVLTGIEQITGLVPQDVSLAFTDHPDTAGLSSIERFIITQDPASGCADTLPGTLCTFSLGFRNLHMPKEASIQLVRGAAIVHGNGVAELDRRQVYVVIPAEPNEIVIL